MLRLFKPTTTLTPRGLQRVATVTSGVAKTLFQVGMEAAKNKSKNKYKANRQETLTPTKTSTVPASPQLPRI